MELRANAGTGTWGVLRDVGSTEDTPPPCPKIKNQAPKPQETSLQDSKVEEEGGSLDEERRSRKGVEGDDTIPGGRTREVRWHSGGSATSLEDTEREPEEASGSGLGNLQQQLRGRRSARRPGKPRESS